MAAMYRLKGLGWLTGAAMVAIGFYLLSSQVAAERKRLEQIDRKIASAERDIRALETEFDVRSNLAQLERWNGDTLALTVPTAQQFVRDEATLAALSPVQGPVSPDMPGEVQTAQLIVPAAPVLVATIPVSVPARATVTVKAAAAAPVATVKVAAVRPAPAPVRAPVVAAAPTAPRLTPAVVRAPAASTRAVKAVAMLDRALLSDTTVGDLLSGARAERGRLR